VRHPGSLLPLGIVLLLSACQTLDQSGHPLVAKPLSPRIRTALAHQLSSEYLGSALGPASISEPKNVTGWSGPVTSLSVRYPVKDRSWLAEEGATISRCIDVTISDRPDGGFAISTSRSRDDGKNCFTRPSMSSFPELTQLRERLQSCKARGEMPCLLSTNMPIAQARKLMKQN
jgi:hypothetical protein